MMCSPAGAATPDGVPVGEEGGFCEADPLRACVRACVFSAPIQRPESEVEAQTGGDCSRASSARTQRGGWVGGSCAHKLREHGSALKGEGGGGVLVLKRGAGGWRLRLELAAACVRRARRVRWRDDGCYCRLLLRRASGGPALTVTAAALFDRKVGRHKRVGFGGDSLLRRPVVATAGEA